MTRRGLCALVGPVTAIATACSLVPTAAIAASAIVSSEVSFEQAQSPGRIGHYHRCFVHFDSTSLTDVAVEQFVAAWWANPELLDPALGCRFDELSGSLQIRDGALLFVYPPQRAIRILGPLARERLKDAADTIAAILHRNFGFVLTPLKHKPGGEHGVHKEEVVISSSYDPTQHRIPMPKPAREKPRFSDCGLVCRSVSLGECTITYSMGDFSEIELTIFVDAFLQNSVFSIAGVCKISPNMGSLVHQGPAMVFVFPTDQARTLRRRAMDFREIALYLARRLERAFAFAFPAKSWHLTQDLATARPLLVAGVLDRN